MSKISSPTYAFQPVSPSALEALALSIGSPSLPTRTKTSRPLASSIYFYRLETAEGI